MPSFHYYASDWVIVENEEQSNSVVTLENSKYEKVLLDFCENIKAKKKFQEEFLELQIYLRGGNAISYVPELVHADPTDLKFELTAVSHSIKLCIHRDNNIDALKELKEGKETGESKEAWVSLIASDSKLQLRLYQFEFKVDITI